MHASRNRRRISQVRRCRRTTWRLRSRSSARSCRPMPPTRRSTGSTPRTSTSRPISRSSRRSPACYDGNQPIDAITVSDALRRHRSNSRSGRRCRVPDRAARLGCRPPPTSTTTPTSSTRPRRGASLMKAGSEVTEFAMKSDDRDRRGHRPGRIQGASVSPSARSATAWSRSGPCSSRPWSGSRSWASRRPN